MNVWKLTAANTLVKCEEDAVPVPGKRRVRVTKVLVNRADALLYLGKEKTRYPIIPGRYAVGIVSDESGSAQIPKGARVLLHSYLPAEDTGTEPKNFAEDDFRICGQTSDGFLRDFVYVREEEMTVLPDAVNDEKALLLSFIALAQATVDALDVRRGEHIAVIGANILGIFVSRLLIYRQAAPILIDARRDRLDFARSRGVYYTSPADETLFPMLGEITGGRLADGAVFIPSAGKHDPALPVSVCAPGKHIAYCGLNPDDLTLDLGKAIRKQLTVHGVPDGTDYLETAINLIANKTLDLSAFRFTTYPADALKELLGELGGSLVPVSEISVINLV